jgi:hypothetical protein
MAVSLGNLVRQDGADRAIDVADRHVDRHLFAALERGLRQLDQPVVEGFFQAVILFLAVAQRHIGRHARRIENARKIQPLCLPMLDALARVE